MRKQIKNKYDTRIRSAQSLKTKARKLSDEASRWIAAAKVARHEFLEARTDSQKAVKRQKYNNLKRLAVKNLNAATRFRTQADKQMYEANQYRANARIKDVPFSAVEQERQWVKAKLDQRAIRNHKKSFNENSTPLATETKEAVPLASTEVQAKLPENKEPDKNINGKRFIIQHESGGKTTIAPNGTSAYVGKVKDLKADFSEAQKYFPANKIRDKTQATNTYNDLAAEYLKSAISNTSHEVKSTRRISALVVPPANNLPAATTPTDPTFDYRIPLELSKLSVDENGKKIPFRFSATSKGRTIMGGMMDASQPNPIERNTPVVLKKSPTKIPDGEVKFTTRFGSNSYMIASEGSKKPETKLVITDKPLPEGTIIRDSGNKPNAKFLIPGNNEPMTFAHFDSAGQPLALQIVDANDAVTFKPIKTIEQAGVPDGAYLHSKRFNPDRFDGDDFARIGFAKAQMISDNKTKIIWNPLLREDFAHRMSLRIQPNNVIAAGRLLPPASNITRRSQPYTTYAAPMTLVHFDSAGQPLALENFGELKPINTIGQAGIPDGAYLHPKRFDPKLHGVGDDARIAFTREQIISGETQEIFNLPAEKDFAHRMSLRIQPNNVIAAGRLLPPASKTTERIQPNNVIAAGRLLPPASNITEPRFLPPAKSLNTLIANDQGNVVAVHKQVIKPDLDFNKTQYPRGATTAVYDFVPSKETGPYAKYPMPVDEIVIVPSKKAQGVKYTDLPTTATPIETIFNPQYSMQGGQSTTKVNSLYSGVFDTTENGQSRPLFEEKMWRTRVDRHGNILGIVSPATQGSIVIRHQDYKSNIRNGLNLIDVIAPVPGQADKFEVIKTLHGWTNSRFKSAETVTNINGYFKDSAGHFISPETIFTGEKGIHRKFVMDEVGRVIRRGEVRSIHPTLQSITSYAFPNPNGERPIIYYQNSDGLVPYFRRVRYGHPQNLAFQNPQPRILNTKSNEPILLPAAHPPEVYYNTQKIAGAAFTIGGLAHAIYNQQYAATPEEISRGRWNIGVSAATSLPFVIDGTATSARLLASSSAVAKTMPSLMPALSKIGSIAPAVSAVASKVATPAMVISSAYQLYDSARQAGHEKGQSFAVNRDVAVTTGSVGFGLLASIGAGAAYGALVGSPTGPGAIVTGLIGAGIGLGAYFVGSYGGGKLGGYLYDQQQEATQPKEAGTASHL